MLTPRYFFAGDYSEFYDYFLTQPHVKKTFRRGEFLWEPGEPFQRIHYIISGAAMHYADHENGRRKIISFHGAGTVYPGYRPNDYKIEISLTTIALSEINVLEFTKEQFRRMIDENPKLNEQLINWYSMFTNRLLFESVHQEYNPSFMKICNLLYLLAVNQPCDSIASVSMTQEAFSELLGLSRIQVTRGLAELRRQNIISTSRGKISIVSLGKLAQLCSSETL